MDCSKLLDNFKNHGFSVKYFETAAEASSYLAGALKGETIGFGGSVTLKDMGLYDLLANENTVCWHWKTPGDRERYAEFTTYITSANAVAETGELVNIDGTGNRVASTLYGPKKLYFVCGINKITPDLTTAIDRARNVAAPANAKRLGYKTPCAVTGKCHDCNSPERICRGMVIHMRPINNFECTEVIIVGEILGF
ncbi:lactate utilization protein [Oscillospiraceae bacterium LTW-04]|nr:lactate utilization protein [Oscillospiraceae bacterium MB24-C1]